ncbi:MAG: hypothetical protein ABSA72_04350 [Nitrososphaerales archaeon]|jgi:hypothetical protein
MERTTHSSDPFIMKLDYPLVVRDVAKFTEIPAALLDLILQNYNQASKEAMSAKRAEKIRSISVSLANVPSKVSVTLCWKDVKVGME